MVSISYAPVPIEIGRNINRYRIIVAGINAGRAGQEPSIGVAKHRIGVDITRPAALYIAVSDGGSTKNLINLIAGITPENSVVCSRIAGVIVDVRAGFSRIVLEGAIRDPWAAVPVIHPASAVVSRVASE